MQAAVLTAPRQFSLREVPAPIPQPGEVLVRVRYAGVCGSDLHFWSEGRIGDVFLAEPFVMGHEFSGIIADHCGIPNAPAAETRVALEPAIPCGHCPFCRTGRTNICPQVRFTGFPPYTGAFAELISVPVENVYPLPASIPDDFGPALETLAVALHGLELVLEVQGKTCAVLGAGSVGLLVLLELLRREANVVLVTEPVPDRREIARRLGCPHVFDPRSEDEIRDHLNRICPYGPKLIFEAAGEPESYQQALDLARPGGVVCLYGIYPKGSFTIDFNHARRKELAVHFVRRSLPRNYPEAIRLVASGEIDVRPILTHRFPLTRIAEAFELSYSRRDGVIKPIVRI